GEHYYIDEIVGRRVPFAEPVLALDPERKWDRGYCFPMRFIFEGDQVKCNVFPVYRDLETNEFFYPNSDVIEIATTDFATPFTTIVADLGGVHPTLAPITDDGYASPGHEVPFNPARELAQGLRIVPVPFSLDRHTVWYLSLVGLEPEALGQEFNLHFLSTSNTAHQEEMLTAIIDEVVRANSERVIAHLPAGSLEDQPEAEDVVIPLLLHFMEGDNPFHSEVTSTPLLGTATWFCRVGKAHLPINCRDAELIKGYMTLEGCPPRKFSETAHIAQGVFDKAASPGGTFNAVKTAMTREGVKDWLNYTIIENTLGREREAAKAEADDEEEGPDDSTATDGPLQDLMAAFRAMLDDEDNDQIEGDEHFFNPLYRLIESMEFDAHKDTPVEILHTFLLGFIKSSGNWPFLRSSPRDLPRDQDVVVPHAFDEPYMVPGDPTYDYSLRTSISLIFKCRANFDHSQDKIDVAVQAFLAATILTDIDWLNKRKYHLPLHMRKCFERIGPALLASTQKQESYNGVFRQHSEYSSKRNAGYEIGLAFSHHNRFTHLVSGGFYRSPTTGKWRQAGSKALDLFRTNANIRGLLGMNDDKVGQAGHLEFRLALPADPAHPDLAEHPDLRRAGSILSHESREPCYRDSFILIRNSTTPSRSHASLTLDASKQPEKPLSVSKISGI
ncbi:hypothetical protein P7C70_g8961, partial [Phenoliferia sp. Uapishka_3]